MSTNSIIISALSPIAPIAFHEYEGSETTYMTFFTTNQRAGLSADNEELSTIYNVQIDLFGKGNIESLSSQVKTALRAKGFIRISEIELYEVNTKTYQKSFTFINS
jgi:hypothetical protein